MTAIRAIDLLFDDAEEFYRHVNVGAVRGQRVLPCAIRFPCSVSRQKYCPGGARDVLRGAPPRSNGIVLTTVRAVTRLSAQIATQTRLSAYAFALADAPLLDNPAHAEISVQGPLPLAEEIHLELRARLATVFTVHTVPTRA